jgi:hypothetical protein
MCQGRLCQLYISNNSISREKMNEAILSTKDNSLSASVAFKLRYEEYKAKKSQIRIHLIEPAEFTSPTSPDSKIQNLGKHIRNLQVHLNEISKASDEGRTIIVEQVGHVIDTLEELRTTFPPVDYVDKNYSLVMEKFNSSEGAIENLRVELSKLLTALNSDIREFIDVEIRSSRTHSDDNVFKIRNDLFDVERVLMRMEFSQKALFESVDEIKFGVKTLLDQANEDMKSKSSIIDLMREGYSFSMLLKTLYDGFPGYQKSIVNASFTLATLNFALLSTGLIVAYPVYKAIEIVKSFK